MKSQFRDLLTEAVLTTAPRLPFAALQKSLRYAVGAQDIAIYLHRVHKTRVAFGDIEPSLAQLSIKEEVLDAVVEKFLEAVPGDARLHLSFDDGYKDACDYIATRAKYFARVEFYFFVCPEKLETRAGFRWDLYALKKAAGEALPPMNEFLSGHGARENDREDLQSLGAREEFSLASIEEVQALKNFSNVKIGNHTNSHLPLTGIASAEAEIEKSRRDFERLFGEMRHFAFPFGTPGVHFSEAHVKQIQESSHAIMWSTKEAAHRRSDRRAGSVLPRIKLLGTWNEKQMLAWLAYRAALSWVR